jgi:outer membrane protein assembly factor BamB
MQRRLKSLLPAVVLLFVLGPVRLLAVDTPGEAAGKILEATEVRGGLVVHAGCGDGELTASFGVSDGFLIHGLERSASQVAAARERANGLGLYGKVSIMRWEGQRLPYIDNLVNLLVIEAHAQPAESEILRVLSPGGVAIQLDPDTRNPRRETLIRKPRPKAMDEWTHFMYDSTGNAVSRDTLVAPPEHLQWVAGPRWGRHHDHMASTSAMVSAGNRVFYIFDEGSTASIMLPARWHLIARDAFNGVVLWKRPIPQWWTHFMPLKSGPAQLTRLLVADAEHVYVTLGLREPVSKLDGATGNTVQTFEEARNTWEMVVHDGLLFAVTGSPRTKEEDESKTIYMTRAPGNPINKLWTGWDRKLLAIDTESGQTRWRLTSKILPGTLAVDSGTLYFHNGESIAAIDKCTGAERWLSQPVAAIDIEQGIPTGYMPSLVVEDGVVVCAGGHGYKQHMKGETLKMVALSAQDGKILWEAPHYTSGYQSPEDLLVVNKTVLSPFSTWLKDKDPKNNHVVGTDLVTGKLVYDNAPDVEDPVWFIHHRCYPSKATTEYLLMSKEGVEFVDHETRHWKIHHWIRGECLYGIMPANGLLYAPMHECACSADMKLCGLNAVAAPKARVPCAIDVKKHRLTKGPAFGKCGMRNSECGTENATSELPRTANIPHSAVRTPRSGDWPTFRHDAARSGNTSCPVPGSPEKRWTTAIEGRLTAPVVAGGKLYVASQHRHTLYVLDADTGEMLWTFTTEGRIDSPPTIFQGMVLFGSRDGCVYCLRASDGALVWRFRAVAEDRRLMAWEQVESVWPIHGSILIRNNEAWFVAGRSAFLDGGLQMYRLKPETGDVISHATLDGKTDDGRVLTGAEEKRLVGLPDILSASGDCVFMRAGVFQLAGHKIQTKLLPGSKVTRYSRGPRPPERIPGKALPHLFSSYGFLDDSWFHRSYWVYGELCSHRHGYAATGKRRPAGRILVCDDETVYGFGRQKKYFNWTTPMEYRLFAEPKQGPVESGVNKALWETHVPILARGLVLAGDTLFAAGPPDVLDETIPGIRSDDPAMREVIDEQEAALAGERGGILLAVSKLNGEVKYRCDLDAPPVFDGLIAANGRLYMTLKDGTVQCWDGQ